jgi:hypothetical protein
MKNDSPPTCSKCGQPLSAQEIKAIAEAYNKELLRKHASAAGKASAARSDMKDRAKKAIAARWKKYREEKAKQQSTQP